MIQREIAQALDTVSMLFSFSSISSNNITKTKDEQLEFCKPEIPFHLILNLVSHPVVGLYVVGCAGGWEDVLINSSLHLI